VLERNNRPVPIVLRVSRRRSSPSRLREELTEDGIVTEPTRFVTDALRVVSGPVKNCAALAEGRAWVQDEAAQLVTCMLGRPVGPRVADLCAAPGGKSLLLADRLGSDGFVAAVDRHAGRLRRMARSLARVGADRSVLPLRADLESVPLPLRGPFDQVLLDAPCSGSGTIGRRPEIRWRLREENLKLLASRQGRLLSAAAGLVRDGGTLVYSVCSMEPEEGQEVVASFLERFAEFRRADPRPALPPPARRLVDELGQLRTSPADGDLDGFFAALLIRKSPARVAGGA
jgi:16S rRNA (cytosine967-C5)-methyltransferase